MNHTLRDPTIPGHGSVHRSGHSAKERGYRAAMTEGWLVDYGKRVVLADTNGRTWSQDQIRMACGTFGFAADGTERAPRPYVYEGSKVIVQGDHLLIHFLDGDPQAPVVIGGVRPIEASSDGNFSGEPHAADPNRLFARQRAVSAAGVQTAYAELDFPGDSPKLELRVGGPTTAAALRAEFDHTAQTIKIGGGAELRLVNENLFADLNSALQEISAALVALGTLPAALAKTTLLIAALTAQGVTYATIRLRGD